MTYATLREALYDFFTHNAPLVSDGDYYSSEDVFTALPYAKGRRYFDAVALFDLIVDKSQLCDAKIFNIRQITKDVSLQVVCPAEFSKN